MIYNKAKNIDEYIRLFPADVQKLLKTLRQTIKKAAPKATEAMKYQMPTFVLEKNLVHFAAYKNHIGFYPTPSAVINFEKDLAKYETSKGAIQLPIDKPIPVGLVSKIVKFRVKETMLYLEDIKAAKKKPAKKSKA